MSNISTTDASVTSSPGSIASIAASKLKAADQAAQCQSDQSVNDHAQSCPLKDRFAIEALVVGEDDKPLMDIGVELRKSPNEVLRDRTGTDGTVRFQQLIDGSYQLSLYELDKDAWELLNTAPLKQPKSQGDAIWQGPPLEDNIELVHAVNQGECTAELSYRYGFFPDTVWNWPKNADLKTLRKDMHILFPGDQLAVPPKRITTIPVATGQHYVVRRKGVPEQLHIRFLDYDKNPRTDLHYRLSITTNDGAVLKDIDGKIDADGFVHATIPPNATVAEILLTEGTGKELHTFNLGYVDPIDTVAGWQKRLNNLGFQCGEEDGILGVQTKAAIVDFQHSQALKETGGMDEATKQALLGLSLS